MKLLKLIMLTLALSLYGNNSYAYGFEIDGIFYTLDLNNMEAKVIKNQNGKYSGNIIIPSEVTYNTRKFKVTSIGESAFAYCDSLTSITIPNTVNSIGPYAFWKSYHISRIILEDGETTLKIGGVNSSSSDSRQDFCFEKYYFENEGYKDRELFYCGRDIEKTPPYIINGVKKIVIGKYVNSFVNYGFSYNPVCDSLIINDSDSLLETDMHCRHFLYLGRNAHAEFGRDKYYYCNKIEIGKKVTHINYGNFRYCVFRDITIPKNVKHIGRSSFSFCNKLKNIELSENVECIEDNAFAGCDSLETLVIGSGVKQIWSNAFSSNILHVTSKITNPLQCIIKGEIFSTKTYLDGTLYVPKGLIDVYRSVDEWKKFVTIQEDEQSTWSNYTLNIECGEGGKILYNGVEINNSTKSFVIEGGKDVEISIIPNNGFHISYASLNGIGITNDIDDTSYTINNINSNYSIKVVFEKNPITLTIQHAENGYIKQIVEDGKSYSFQIESANGWKINTVLYNGQDVTNQLTNDGFFTTPAIAENSTLNVSFESTAESSVLQAYFNDIKVYANGNTIYIKGIKQGETVSVYDLGGSMIKSIVSKCDSIEIPLPNDQVYIVRTTDKVFKVGL